MDRRKFLKTGAVAGGAGAALEQSGCAHGPAQTGTAAAWPDLATAEAVAGGLDRRLDWIDQQRAMPASLGIPAWPSQTADERAAQEGHGRLFRQSLRTLYLTGRFLDLPRELQTSPHVQARVAAAQPEMDEAVLGMTAMV